MQRDARTMLLDAIASGERIESWTRTMSRASSSVIASSWVARL
jgi:hypothetical protein